MYKVYKGDTVVDALEDLQCVCFYDGIGILRCKTTDVPQGIISYDGNKIYHVDGWPKFPEGEYETVTLQAIDRNEYTTIREALDSGLDAPVEQGMPEQESVKTTAQLLQEQIEAVSSQVKQVASFAGAPEDAFVATQNYVKGSVIIVGGGVYKTIRNIEKGAKIVPYLNVVQTNLSEMISES